MGVTRLVGDGNPHQNYLQKQLSPAISCGAAPSCSVQQEDSISYTLGFDVSAEIEEFITGGFDVEVSIETGTAYQCDGNAGDTVCLWFSQAFTAYTVQNGNQNECTGFTPVGGPIVVVSPNTDNAGGHGYYCVNGPCRTQGSEYWDYDGPAGGPP